MTLEPLISVIIPTYQRCASVERLLKALNQQTMMVDSYEVIVSIDGSTDGTRDLVDQKQFPFSLKSIWNPNQGRATACNTGINAAQGRLIVLLDDDMEPSPRLLEAHWKAHQERSNVAVIGAVPIYLGPASSQVTQYIGNKFNQHLEKLSQPNYTPKLRDFYSGNFSILSFDLLRVGLFDTHFKEYGNEDLELSWRFRQAGIQLIYSPEALAVQHYEKDFSDLARDNLSKGRTSVLFAKLHPEAVTDIKLGTYDQESLRWRVFRAALLFASRVIKHLPQYIIQLMSGLERRRPAQLHLYFRVALDYFYWLGVETAEK